MKVDNPRFDKTGEVLSCMDCPLDRGFDDEELCREWWDRNGVTRTPRCPNEETYALACRFAEPGLGRLITMWVTVCTLGLIAFSYWQCQHYKEPKVAALRGQVEGRGR